MKNYDKNKRVFIFSGWEMKLPSISDHKNLMDFYTLAKFKSEEKYLYNDITLLYFLKDYTLNYERIY